MNDNNSPTSSGAPVTHASALIDMGYSGKNAARLGDAW